MSAPEHPHRPHGPHDPHGSHDPHGPHGAPPDPPPDQHPHASAHASPGPAEPAGPGNLTEPAATVPEQRAGSGVSHLAGGATRTGSGSDDPELGHDVLKSLLGAWALAACSAAETAAVERHLTDCASCADEALRLRDAVGLLHAEDSLDLDPMLRSRVLEGCLVRRPARIPVPDWAAPYDAETARLDALLRDMADDEWRAPVRLRWFDGRREAERETTVEGVLSHLLAVDGLVAAALGLPDPVPRGTGPDPVSRTEALWARNGPAHAAAGQRTHDLWRGQSHTMIRDVSFGEEAAAGLNVSYGDFALPLRDAFLDRAFECWMHAEDIADAVDYPYGPPTAAHLNLLVDLAARQLPGAVAGRRRAGLAAPPRRLAPAGAPGRTLHLEVEGSGGGDWYIPLDSPGAAASQEPVAHVALDGLEFCQLAAGHVPPQEAAAGQDGDREAIRDVLFAAASLSRL